MVGPRHSSLARLLDEGSPPTTIFATLSKKWTPGAGDIEAFETTVWSLRVTVDLTLVEQAKTGGAPHEILHTITGNHAEGVNWLTLLTVNGYGLIYLLQSLYCI